MKKNYSTLILVLILMGISVVVYLIQINLFHKPEDSGFYFLQDMAFLPMQVALVSVVLQKLFSQREKKERLKKMNMAISAFFSEAGTDIISSLVGFSNPDVKIKSQLDIDANWSKSDFQKAAKLVADYDFGMDSRAGNLYELKSLLQQKRTFLLTMLENPNLLEHDTFTDMLWAVFHVTDELNARDTLTNLPAADMNHLSSDMKRAFGTLLVQWVNYTSHLRTDYPYLFSMATRKNPFNDNSSIIIT